MNQTPTPESSSPKSPYLPKEQLIRYFILLALECFFLLVSTVTGGFKFSIWSMLDSALWIMAIGVTGLLFIIDNEKIRRILFYTTLGLYILAVIDMAVNVMISGAMGWG